MRTLAAIVEIGGQIRGWLRSTGVQSKVARRLAARRAARVRI